MKRKTRTNVCNALEKLRDFYKRKEIAEDLRERKRICK